MMELQSAGVAAGAVLTAVELLDDPQLRERGFFAELDQPDVGPRPYPGTPVLLDGERASDWTPAPTLGQHNEEVLGGLLGVGEDELRALYERGVIADRPPA
jgi:crotonobetainyl-CoA:carnitine CoA-transferase CaiB-like acyl-CoA transferase